MVHPHRVSAPWVCSLSNTLKGAQLGVQGLVEFLYRNVEYPMHVLSFPC
jgi:hypothetical protein